MRGRLAQLELVTIQTSTHGLPVCHIASVDDPKLLVPLIRSWSAKERHDRVRGDLESSSMFRLLSRHWHDDQTNLRSYLPIDVDICKRGKEKNCFSLG